MTGEPNTSRIVFVVKMQLGYGARRSILKPTCFALLDLLLHSTIGHDRSICHHITEAMPRIKFVKQIHFQQEERDCEQKRNDPSPEGNDSNSQGNNDGQVSCH